MMAYKNISLVFLFVSLFLNTESQALVIKMATMAPNGTSWATALEHMAAKIKSATKNQIELDVRDGGAAGDEITVLRKMRRNLYHGAVFTALPLGEIDGNIRAMEIPFTFKNDRAKALKTLQDNASFFDKGLEKGGIHNLGYLEVGPVYLISTKKVTKVEDLKGIKFWSRANDKLSSSLIKALQLTGTQIPIQEVLGSFSTGVIEAAYSPALAMLALQWNTKVKYLLNYPVTYAVGAVVLNKKVWDKLSNEHKKIISEISASEIKLANEKTVRSNDESLELMQQTGIQFLNFEESEVKKVTVARDQVIKDLVNQKVFNQEAVDIVNKNRVL